MKKRAHWPLPVGIEDRSERLAEIHRRMAEIILFHHSQGLTDGVVSFADRLREVFENLVADNEVTLAGVIELGAQVEL